MIKTIQITVNWAIFACAVPLLLAACVAKPFVSVARAFYEATTSLYKDVKKINASI